MVAIEIMKKISRSATLKVMKLLGVDYGTQRIGLAVADSENRIATPLTIISNDDRALSRIADICDKKDIDTVVVGESVDALGNENEVMKHIKQFAEQLKQSASVEIAFANEFLSSVEARRQPDPPGHVDGSAAAVILQRYLEQVDEKD